MTDQPYELEGKVALVTGASRGVGAAIAEALAAAGATVACAARATADSPQRTPGTLDDTVARIAEAGGAAFAVPTNLAVPGEVEAMVERTVAEVGRLDVLVNNAAITFVGDLDIPLKRHELIMAVNVTAPLVAMHAAAPHLRAAGGGRIVNLSSVAALLPIPGLMSYGVSKLALERMTVDAANQLQGDGVAVNVFRIDLPVASEGFIANTPGVDRTTWEPCEVAAEGVVWLLRQPDSHSGRLESMLELRQREGIMASRSEASYPDVPPTTTLFTGLARRAESMFQDG